MNSYRPSCPNRQTGSPCPSPKAEQPATSTTIHDCPSACLSTQLTLWNANGNPAVIAALLDGGADPNARSKDGQTPWDFAQENAALKETDAWWRLNDGRF